MIIIFCSIVVKFKWSWSYLKKNSNKIETAFHFNKNNRTKWKQRFISTKNIEQKNIFDNVCQFREKKRNFFFNKSMRIIFEKIVVEISIWFVEKRIKRRCIFYERILKRNFENRQLEFIKAYALFKCIICFRNIKKSIFFAIVIFPKMLLNFFLYVVSYYFESSIWISFSFQTL